MTNTSTSIKRLHWAGRSEAREANREIETRWFAPRLTIEAELALVNPRQSGLQVRLPKFPTRLFAQRISRKVFRSYEFMCAEYISTNVYHLRRFVERVELDTRNTSRYFCSEWSTQNYAPEPRRPWTLPDRVGAVSAGQCCIGIDSMPSRRFSVHCSVICWTNRSRKPSRARNRS
jgi:hypothetical protein